MTRSAVLAADVLLVEDDPGDVLLTGEAFEDHHPGLQLHVVGDGETAMRFLRRTDDFAGMPRPALVVLDLNLPHRSGLEVLGEVKADPCLHM
jgi:CheY-like chemotaxis protein